MVQLQGSSDYAEPYHPVGKVVVMSNPYHIEQRGSDYVVVKSKTGEVVPGETHKTRSDAVRHLDALEENVRT